METMLFSLLIGIMVMLAIYLSLTRVMNISNLSIRRALALFSAAVGILVTFWLKSNPDILGSYTREIVFAGLGVVLALIFLARKLIS